ncbi:hypothetical protein NDU88_001671 [Pleurodeles waltl]|uniref:Uncharacterized protein n=1 Tax=Pleurodeles waltl TaxID=8319 RepID=A0AAV7TJ04_PLEWA|nr:hypothetical protein NDU88_001671 [Pleurodeles waltl]
MHQGEGRALCLGGVAFWEAAEGFRAGALGRSGRSAVAAPAEGSSRVPVSDRPGQGGRTGTGGHRPPPRGGGGRAEAQPERGTQGESAGRDRRGRLTERSFRAAGENALGGGGGGRRHSGARTAMGGGFPGPGATRPLSTLVGPLGGRKLPGCLAFALPGRAFRETAGPRVGRSLAGLEALCLKQQPRLAKQSIPKRTKCAQSIGVRCWLDPGRQSALWAARFGGETRRTRVRGGSRATRALGARSRTTGPPDHEGVRRTLSLVIRRKIWALPGSWCAPSDGGDRRRERTRPPGALAGQEGANEPSSGLPGQPGHLDAP